MEQILTFEYWIRCQYNFKGTISDSPSYYSVSNKCCVHVANLYKFMTSLMLHSPTSPNLMIYVATCLCHSLLGCPAIESLNLITTVDSIDTKNNDYVTKCPQLFTGLVSFDGEYKIKLKPHTY